MAIIQPPTFQPARIILCRLDGSNPIDVTEGIPLTSEAIEVQPSDEPTMFKPITGTLSFNIKGNFKSFFRRDKWKLLIWLRSRPRRWPRLTCKTIRHRCAKRNRRCR